MTLIKYLSSLIISVIISVFLIANTYHSELNNAEVLFSVSLIMISCFLMIFSVKQIAFDMKDIDEKQQDKFAFKSITLLILGYILSFIPLHLIKSNLFDNTTLELLSLFFYFIFSIGVVYLLFKPFDKNIFHFKNLLSLMIFFIIYVYSNYTIIAVLNMIASV